MLEGIINICIQLNYYQLCFDDPTIIIFNRSELYLRDNCVTIFILLVYSFQFTS